MYRYYVVLMNSLTQTYVTGVCRLSGRPSSLDDIEEMLTGILKDMKEVDTKDTEHWFILNFILLGEEHD